jgi:sigma-E factor negative regulatory protein RseB
MVAEVIEALRPDRAGAARTGLACLWDRRHWLGSALAALACPLPVWAVSPMVPAEARAWLHRTHEAASRYNYQGVVVVSASGTVSSSRLVHFSDGAQQLERVEALDGEPRSMLRVNENMHTLWPRPQLVVVEQRDARASFPSLLSGTEPRVLESYEMFVLGRERFAGHEADVVLLRARDPWRYSQRLWADRQTGLLLRIDVMNAQGQVLESAGFSELTIGMRPQPELVTAPLRRLDSFRVIRREQRSTSLETEGWSLAALPAGFRDAGCTRRVLEQGGSAGGAVTVVQALFTDGLTHVSLFIEPFSPQRHQGEAAVLTGATQTIMSRRESDWVTLMGDVPVDTLRRFAAALDRRR